MLGREFEPRAGAIPQFLQMFSLILKNGSFCKAVPTSTYKSKSTQPRFKAFWVTLYPVPYNVARDFIHYSMLQVDQLREENEALRAKAAEAAAAASAERPAAVEAVERVREVVVVKEDEDGKARADAARKEVEEVGASYHHTSLHPARNICPDRFTEGISGYQAVVFIQPSENQPKAVLPTGLLLRFFPFNLSRQKNLIGRIVIERK